MPFRLIEFRNDWRRLDTFGLGDHISFLAELRESIPNASSHCLLNGLGKVCKGRVGMYRVEVAE